MERPERTGQPSWLMAMLDSENIKSRRALERFLITPKHRRKLRQTMEEVPYSPPKPDSDASAPLAAGARLDLGSVGACLAPECLIRDADKLVQRTWHYFDRIYVVGPSANKLAQSFDDEPEFAVARICDYSELLFHLREIGAEPYLSFGSKPPACMEHLPNHASDAGMGELLDAGPFIVKFALEANCEVRFVGTESQCKQQHWEYTLDHPTLDHTHWGTVHAGKHASHGAVVELALGDAHRYFVAHLIQDTRFARYTHASLGIGATVHEALWEGRITASPSEFDVAFNVPLPFIDKADPKELLRFRAAEQESYDVFHHALRKAINERIRVSGGDQKDSVQIAMDIATDVIDPALAKLSQKLSLSERLLAKTAGVSAGVATIGMTVGALSSVPLTVGPLVAAAVGVVDYKRYLADRNAMRAEDIYFLWKMVEVAGHRHGRS